MLGMAQLWSFLLCVFFWSLPSTGRIWISSLHEYSPFRYNVVWTYPLSFSLLRVGIRTAEELCF